MASCDESNEHRQRDELACLQSMFDNAVTNETKKVAWQNWCPLDVKLLLMPTKGDDNRDDDEVYAELVLHVQCCEDYPNKVPTITLENVRGVPVDTVGKLHDHLLAMARERVGNEMIYDLAMYVQDFLLPFNRPADMRSCFDEMVASKQRLAEQEEVLHALQLSRKRQEFQKTIKQLSQHGGADSNQNDLESVDEMEEVNIDQCEQLLSELRNEDLHSSEHNNMQCKHSPKAIRFPHYNVTVQRGSCIAHHASSASVYSGMIQKTGKLVCINEWKISAPYYGDQNNIEDELCHLYSDFQKLTELDHPGVGKYLYMTHNYMKREKLFTIYIVKEFTFGIPVKAMLLHDNNIADLVAYKRIAAGILSAMAYLHSKDIVLEKITSSDVYLNSDGQIHLCSYLIENRVRTLHPTQTGSSKYTTLTDLEVFADIMRTLISYGETSDQPSNNIEPDLNNLLEACSSSQSVDNSAQRLLEHAFFKKDINAFATYNERATTITGNNLKSLELPVPPMPSTTTSRMASNYDILDKIGKGSFGRVLKVQSRIDKRIYALKKIKFEDQKDSAGIMREVSSLAHLSHENVVRYYTSWFDDDKDDDDSSSDDETESAIQSEELKSPMKLIVKRTDSDLEKFAPRFDDEHSVRFDSSYPKRRLSSYNDEEEDSDDNNEGYDDDLSDDESLSLNMFEREDCDSDSDDVDFDNSGGSLELDCARPKPSTRILYILMEYCEKKTLKTEIINDLYLNPSRMWQLLREIVMGLQYIHDQELIHRDLKPDNIFLDARGNIKIGDFGFARIRNDPEMNLTVASSKQSSQTFNSMTGGLGTSFYTAPELLKAAATSSSNKQKFCYSELVDMYSLGVIIFEMCYRPVVGMERQDVLSTLCREKTVFPIDFKNDKAKAITKKLLNHDAKKRPTCLELLKQLPPPPEEEANQAKFIHIVLSDSKLKMYKLLMDECFRQQDPRFDLEIMHTNWASSVKMRNMFLENKIRADIMKVFQSYGYIEFTTPLLTPKILYNDADPFVKVMMQNGEIAGLPYDFRLPMAHFLICNNVLGLRRFSFNSIFRTKINVLNEIPQCVFDVVGDNEQNVADCEAICVLSEIVSSISVLHKRPLVLRLNHRKLITAVLLYFGVSESKLADCFKFIGLPTVKGNRWVQLAKRCNLSVDMLKKILHFLNNKECTIDKIIKALEPITKSNNKAAQYANDALRELQRVVQNAQYFGVSFQIRIALNLITNIHRYSGIVCQLVYCRHHGTSADTIAAGGRYDQTINDLSQSEYTIGAFGKFTNTAIGMSIYLDRLFAYSMQNIDELENSEIVPLDAIICSFGKECFIEEKIKLLRLLIRSRIRCQLVNALNFDEVDRICNSLLDVPCAVIFKDDRYNVTVHYPCINKKDVRLSVTDLVDHLKFEMHTKLEPIADSSRSTVSKSDSNVSVEKYDLLKSNIDIIFIDRKGGNHTKGLEKEIRSKVQQRLNYRDIIVISVPWTKKLLFDFDETEGYRDPNSMPKVKSKVIKEISNVRNRSTNPMIILYGTIDASYRALI